MNRARWELDRLGTEARGKLAGDLRTTASRLVRVGGACTREHPVLVLGGGALLAALAVWRMNRPAPIVIVRPHGAAKRRGVASRLLQLGRFGLVWALSLSRARA